MVQNEKELANAIMMGSSRIELSENMIGGVRKILAPSEILWASVVTALGTSAFFWGGPCAMVLGMTVGLPTILTVSGGVGGIVFVTLGIEGTLMAFKLLTSAQKLNVITSLHEMYEIKDNILKKKQQC